MRYYMRYFSSFHFIFSYRHSNDPKDIKNKVALFFLFTISIQKIQHSFNLNQALLIKGFI